MPDHLAIPWHRPEDYPRLLALFEDSHKLPARFEQWLAKAEQLAQAQTARGVRVHRVILDPDMFSRWCRSEHLNLDAEARVRFANHIAAQTIAKEQAEGK
jgi:hypothetical protein